MDSQPTLRRRTAGILNSRLPDLDLERMSDPRHEKGRKWKQEQLATATLTALMAGRKSTAEAESLTEQLSPAMRKKLGLVRRLPDTTWRDWLCQLPATEVRNLIHRCVRAAGRRNALGRFGFPLHVVAMDGKSQVLPSWDEEYAQYNHHEESGLEYGHLRTVTSCLVTARGRPCLDAFPIPASTNEMGIFEDAFGELVRLHGRRFSVVYYDAGASSEDNAQLVLAAEKDYLFRLKNENRLMLQWAERLLGHLEVPLVQTVEWLAKGQRKEPSKSNRSKRKKSATTSSKRQQRSPMEKKVIRKLFMVDNKPTKKNLLVWGHTRTLIRVRSETYENGTLIREGERYFNTSLSRDAMTDEQWLALIRSVWGVENNCHHTYDKAFEEDDRPWITDDPQGTLAVTLFRRVAYNLWTLFRSVTQRGKNQRATAWKTLMERMYNTCIAATEQELAKLRQRQSIVACS